MGPFKIIALTTLLTGATLFAGYATLRDFGVQKVNYPQGIRLRDESIHAKRAGVLAPVGRGRSHRPPQPAGLDLPA